MQSADGRLRWVQIASALMAFILLLKREFYESAELG